MSTRSLGDACSSALKPHRIPAASSSAGMITKLMTTLVLGIEAHPIFILYPPAKSRSHSSQHGQSHRITKFLRRFVNRQNVMDTRIEFSILSFRSSALCLRSGDVGVRGVEGG